MKTLLFLGLLLTTALASVPKFAFCDGDGSNYEYQIDLAATYTDPKDMVKNVLGKLFINGYFADDV